MYNIPTFAMSQIYMCHVRLTESQKQCKLFGVLVCYNFAFNRFKKQKLENNILGLKT